MHSGEREGHAASPFADYGQCICERGLVIFPYVEHKVEKKLVLL
jgi:hypothetical protein